MARIQQGHNQMGSGPRRLKGRGSGNRYSYPQKAGLFRVVFRGLW
jgi:hypothetical protein